MALNTKRVPLSKRRKAAVVKNNPSVFRHGNGQMIRVPKPLNEDDPMDQGILKDMHYQMLCLNLLDADEIREMDAEDFDYDELLSTTRVGEMDYKGFHGIYRHGEESDGEAEMFYGHVTGLRNAGILFHGTTLESLESDFHAAINDFLSDLRTPGSKPLAFYVPPVAPPPSAAPTDQPSAAAS
jgi:hypothetical protein